MILRVFLAPVELLLFILHLYHHGHATRLLYLAGVAGPGTAGAPVRRGSSLGGFPYQKVREMCSTNNSTAAEVPLYNTGCF